MTDFAEDLERQARADQEAAEVAEYLGAYNFGRSVQRVEDHRAAEASRGSIVMAHLFCAFSGFIVGLLVAGIMTVHYLVR